MKETGRQPRQAATLLGQMTNIVGFSNKIHCRLALNLRWRSTFLAEANRRAAAIAFAQF
jgi:hypothetical protein